MLIPFGDWTPDKAAFTPGSAAEALNVVPTNSGYGPVLDFVNLSTALSSRAQGHFIARNPQGTARIFVGNATKLYRIAAGGSVTDISRTVGGAYATPSTGAWSFIQFGDTVLASNGVDTVQFYTMSVTATFENVAVFTPIFYYGTVIKEFGVTAGTTLNQNRVRWSGIGDVTSAWTSSAATLADFQDLPDGGICTGLTGGEFGVVFQERAVNRMTFEGPPTAFRFDKISTTIGCGVPGSIAPYENFVFFLSNDGFKVITGGQQIDDIGDGKVDDWLEDNFDKTYFYRCSSTIDPVRKLYLFSFPNLSATSGAPNQVLCYHWPTQRWSRWSMSVELLCNIYNDESFVLAAHTTSSLRLGTFTGSSLAATLTTQEMEVLPGRRTLVRSFRPIIDGALSASDITARFYKRKHQHEVPASSGSTVAITDRGRALIRGGDRFMRFEVGLGAATDWTHAIGIDEIVASPMSRK